MNSSSDPTRNAVGVIDVGSNTIKLLVAERDKAGELFIRRYKVEDTRIGEGLTGNPPYIDDAALQRGTESIKRLVDNATDVSALCIVATSAVRDASNKQTFINRVERSCQRELRVLSGDEEARFIGRGIQADPRLRHLDTFSLLDLGGGSMECLQFANHRLLNAESLQLGSVRLASRLVKQRAQPLSAEDEARICEHVLASWKDSSIALGSSPSPIAILTGGAASLLGETLGEEQRDRGLSLHDFIAIKDRICAATLEQRIQDHDIPASRADIYPTALVTLVASLRYLGCDQIRFSHYNLRYGIAATLLEQGQLEP